MLEVDVLGGYHFRTRENNFHDFEKSGLSGEKSSWYELPRACSGD